MGKLLRIMVLVMVALALTSLVPERRSEADCVGGYIYGTGNSGCLMCMSVGGAGVCRDVLGNGHCACSEFGTSCVSGGGFCEYWFIWWP